MKKIAMKSKGTCLIVVDPFAKLMPWITTLKNYKLQIKVQKIMFNSFQPIYKIKHFKNAIILNFIKQPDGQKSASNANRTSTHNRPNFTTKSPTSNQGHQQNKPTKKKQTSFVPPEQHQQRNWLRQKHQSLQQVLERVPDNSGPLSRSSSNTALTPIGSRPALRKIEISSR